MYFYKGLTAQGRDLLYESLDGQHVSTSQEQFSDCSDGSGVVVVHTSRASGQTHLTPLIQLFCAIKPVLVQAGVSY